MPRRSRFSSCGQMLVHDPPHQRVLDAEHVELEQQALAQVAGGDAGRVEPLHARERGGGRLPR